MRLLLLNTGGTISSVRTEEGVRPELNSSDFMRQLEPSNGRYTIEARDIFDMDSTDIGPVEWRRLAQEIVDADRLKGYDAYVITHGTDTAGFTAAALSFLLRGFPKPVYLTGAIRSADEPFYDGIDNLSETLSVALELAKDICGVFVQFAGKLIHGCHAVKVDAADTDAFCSIGAPVVARISHGQIVSQDPSWKDLLSARKRVNVRSYRPDERRYLIDPLDPHVLLMDLTPGFDPNLLSQLATMEWPLRALILETYGSGGIPITPDDYAPHLRKLVSKGIFVVIGTQVLAKNDNLDRYEVGRRTRGLGIVKQNGLTAEAAVAKLMWMLPKARDRAMLTSLYEENVAFEYPVCDLFC